MLLRHRIPVHKHVRAADIALHGDFVVARLDGLEAVGLGLIAEGVDGARTDEGVAQPPEVIGLDGARPPLRDQGEALGQLVPGEADAAEEADAREGQDRPVGILGKRWVRRLAGVIVQQAFVRPRHGGHAQFQGHVGIPRQVLQD